MVNIIAALCGCFTGKFVCDTSGTFEVILSYLRDNCKFALFCG